MMHGYDHQFKGLCKTLDPLPDILAGRLKAGRRVPFWRQGVLGALRQACGKCGGQGKLILAWRDRF